MRCAASSWSARVRGRGLRSSSSRAVTTSRSRHGGIRRVTKASSRSVISSAQCRSSSTARTACRAASASISRATLSKSRSWLSPPPVTRAPPPLARAGPARHARAGQHLQHRPVHRHPGRPQRIHPRTKGQDLIALVAPAQQEPSVARRRFASDLADQRLLPTPASPTITMSWPAPARPAQGLAQRAISPSRR